MHTTHSPGNPCQHQFGRSKLAGAALLLFLLSFNPCMAAPQGLPLRPATARGALAPDELNNIAVFKAASPSVVHITTLELATNLFTLDVMQIPRGTGSGFIWDERGYIVTNFHVIQEANAARVTLSDQTNWKAELVGAFPDRDLAVLRIEAPKEKLKPIIIGESGNLQVGQKVYAIGNPFGLDQTLTTGIVSALNREIQSVTQRPIHGVIQTDAAINPGNSGGPLLDSAGRLIGVNTAIYSPSGASSGIGFAIPVDEVRRIVPRLIRDGKIIRPTLGIHGASDNVRQSLRLPPGIVIIGVERGGPAGRAGLRPFYRGKDGRVIQGDELVAISGSPVTSIDDLLTILERHQAGDKVTVTLLRSGQRLEKTLTLVLPDD
ncbi:MAG: trypsin-like peptidase domain-containing protein [Gallionellaceae bacterium]|nr:trypsin-like peptidase domain-containing protein [Gallionellaceae bacterium]